VALLLFTGCDRADDAPVVVGAKLFPESEILALALADVAEQAGAEAEYRTGVGDSAQLFLALQQGQLDAYPEYTGTLREELLEGEDTATDAALRERLAERGLGIAAEFGFENTFELGMKRATAERLGIRTIGDLADHPELRMVFGTSFLERPDGWPGLVKTYSLPQTDVRGVEQGLRYPALETDSGDVIDLYSTDAEIELLDLVKLEDDREFFPEYDAIIVYRLALEQTRPAVVEAWRALGGRVTVDVMIAANKRVAVDDEPTEAAAAGLLAAAVGDAGGLDEAAVSNWRDRARRIAWATLEHAGLVAFAVGAAVVLAVPMGVWAGNGLPGGRAILVAVGLIQTIPALALLVVLIAPLKLGFWPAAVTLVLYALLPIVRNTHAALVGIDPAVRESAMALGLTPRDRLWRVELPLALPGILAGVKIAAVTAVGFATLGAFVGAGGYGEPIYRGLRIGTERGYDDILEGAIPAAVMALGVQALLAGLERWAVSPGLRR
jgi:osmoprotectant transport system permease protein